MQLTIDLSSLSKENQQLKSQLFDSMQVEKALKAQLAGSGQAASAAVLLDAGKVARLQEEVSVLQQALETKENEHKELMAICTDLISQVETLKAAQTSY